MNNKIFESKEFINAIEDKEFLKILSEKKDRNSIKIAFKSKGVEMTDADLDNFAEKLEEIRIGEVSGGKPIGEGVGDFISDHPWLTFFTINALGSALIGLPVKIIQAIKTRVEKKKSNKINPPAQVSKGGNN